MNDSILKRYEIEREEKWTDFVKDIPFLQFDKKWQIRVIPPFGGAMARFNVSDGKNNVSVYLDCHEALGYWGSPYWEAYPVESDVFRCGIDEPEKLIEAIRKSLHERNDSRISARFIRLLQRVSKMVRGLGVVKWIIKQD